MSTTILDGKRIREEILAGLRPQVERLVSAGRRPGLAVVLVGNDPGSEIYVRNKVKACADLGIYSEKITPPESVTTDELLAIVQALNARPDIHGILVQMPLPPHVDSRRVLPAIDPAKDVDGFHPFNVGKLVANAPGPRPCTPAGIMEMLRRYGIAVAGKRACVVGRSDIVGKPMALLLLHSHATVTVCHSKTPDLPGECRRADILVAAIGRAHFITPDFVKPGAVLIDVGINRNEAGKVTGDIHPDAHALSSAYTPVPGGVGLLTVAMLMANTVAAAGG